MKAPSPNHWTTRELPLLHFIVTPPGTRGLQGQGSRARETKVAAPSHNCPRPEVTYSAHIPIGQILVPLPHFLQGGWEGQSSQQNKQCEERLELCAVHGETAHLTCDLSSQSSNRNCATRLRTYQSSDSLCLGAEGIQLRQSDR